MSEQIKFANLGNLNISDAALRKFKETEEFTKMRNITGWGSRFQKVKAGRNTNIHPEELNVSEGLI